MNANTRPTPDHPTEPQPSGAADSLTALADKTLALGNEIRRKLRIAWEGDSIDERCFVRSSN